MASPNVVFRSTALQRVDALKDFSADRGKEIEFIPGALNDFRLKGDASVYSIRATGNGEWSILGYGRPQAGAPPAAAVDGLKQIRGIIGRMYDNGAFHPGPRLAGEQPDATNPRDAIRGPALAYLDTL